VSAFLANGNLTKIKFHYLTNSSEITTQFVFIVMETVCMPLIKVALNIYKHTFGKFTSILFEIKFDTEVEYCWKLNTSCWKSLLTHLAVALDLVLTLVACIILLACELFSPPYTYLNAVQIGACFFLMANLWLLLGLGVTALQNKENLKLVNQLIANTMKYSK